MWREVCSRDKFKFHYDHPEDFAICFWQSTPKVSKGWIAYRALIVLFFSLSIFVVIIIRSQETSPWYKSPIFFYYWVDFTEIFTFVLGLTISVQRFRKQKKNPELPPMEKMPFHYQLMWITYVIAAPCAGVVTILFCIYIQDKEDYPYLKYSILTHLTNTACFLVDYSVCAVPIRLLHLYLPVCFGTVYVIFSVIYQSSGGTGNEGKIPIFKTMDWRNPTLALETCTVYLLGLITTHIAYWMMNELKNWAKNRRTAQEQTEQEQTEHEP